MEEFTVFAQSTSRAPRLAAASDDGNAAGQVEEIRLNIPLCYRQMKQQCYWLKLTTLLLERLSAIRLVRNIKSNIGEGCV